MTVILFRSEEKFLETWPKIRSKGKARYVITRGLFRAMLLYILWAVVTWFFDGGRFSPEHFRERYYYYIVIYLLLGMVLSSSAWKGNNMKYDNLIRYGKWKEKTDLES